MGRKKCKPFGHSFAVKAGKGLLDTVERTCITCKKVTGLSKKRKR